MKTKSEIQNGVLHEEYVVGNRRYVLKAQMFNGTAAANDHAMHEVLRWRCAQKQRVMLNERRAERMSMEVV